MHLTSTLPVLLLTLTSTTLCAPHQKRLTENKPWHLNSLNLFVSSSSNNTSSNSTFAFGFSDTNPGLELNTTCSRSTNGAIFDGAAYYSCTNNTVGFRFDGKTLDVQRTYIDPSVSAYPFWYVTAFGHADTDLKVLDTAAQGTRSRQDSLDVKITEMISK